jgi:hypothetical protein
VNLSWNASIPAGGQSAPSTIGFNGSYTGANAKPTSITLNGTACTLS